MNGRFNCQVWKPETIGDPTIKTMKKMTDFCCFNEFRIMNKYFVHQGIHKFMWQAGNTKSVIDCKLEMRK